jgi:hypothetical protein
MTDDEQAERLHLESVMGLPNFKVAAKFILGCKPNVQLSDELGRPIYVEEIQIVEISEGFNDYVSRPIMVGGPKDDAKRFPVEWQLFQEAIAHPKYQAAQIPGIKPHELAMLRERGFHYIQDVAAIANPEPEILQVVLRAQRWMLIQSGAKPRMKLEAVA